MPLKSQESTPFFSIVMPVYGVERYIADAIADVLVQTERDFELIVVDDCTTDRAIEVAREVAGNDPRVRIVRRPRNGGLSAARNTGMDEARGTWLLIPDPDDRMEENLLERVRQTIEAFAPDLVMFGHTDDYYGPDGAFLYRNDIPIDAGIVQDKRQLGRTVLQLEKQTNLGYAWNKAFRMDIVRTCGLTFKDDAALIEDLLFTMEYLRAVRTFAVIDDCLYFYKRRQGSNLTGKFVPDYFELHRRRVKEIRDFLDECGVLDHDAKRTLGALYARFIISTVAQNADPRANMSSTARRAWLSELRDDELYRELVPGAEADESKLLAACLALLRGGHDNALLVGGRVIHFVRYHSTSLYTKAKSRR